MRRLIHIHFLALLLSLLDSFTVSSEAADLVANMSGELTVNAHVESFYGENLNNSYLVSDQTQTVSQILPNERASASVHAQTLPFQNARASATVYYDSQGTGTFVANNDLLNPPLLIPQPRLGMHISNPAGQSVVSNAQTGFDFTFTSLLDTIFNLCYDVESRRYSGPVLNRRSGQGGLVVVRDGTVVQDEFLGYPVSPLAGVVNVPIVAGSTYTMRMDVPHYETLNIYGEAQDRIHLYDGVMAWSFDTIPGLTANNPILPIPGNPGSSFNFANPMCSPDRWYYYDPDVATGYDYEVFGGTKITSVLIPSSLPGGDDTFEILYNDTSATIFAGEPFEFGSGVSSFSIRGIDPAEGLDPADPTAFVTGLKFTGEGPISMAMTPFAPVPEPSTIAMWSIFGLIGGFVAWRKRKRA